MTLGLPLTKHFPSPLVVVSSSRYAWSTRDARAAHDLMMFSSLWLTDTETAVKHWYDVYMTIHRFFSGLSVDEVRHVTPT